jgi:CubicO group peptidase (beta-lactamase class C family)
MPLLYEPGESWAYSCGIDWAGKMVERVNGGVSLGEYMKRLIFEPLGMTSTGFRPAQNENIRKNLCPTTKRTAEGKLEPSDPYPAEDPKDDLGGGGLYSSAPDYIKVLISLLKNDGKLLKPATVTSMMKGHLEKNQHLNQTVANPLAGPMLRGGVDCTNWDFGLGGIVAETDVPGVCKKGTFAWSGLPNLFWVCISQPVPMSKLVLNVQSVDRPSCREMRHICIASAPSRRSRVTCARSCIPKGRLCE